MGQWGNGAIVGPGPWAPQARAIRAAAQPCMAPAPWAVPEAVGRQSVLLATALCAKPMSLIDAFGYLAATISTMSFVPQVWHTFKTRNVSGISLGMYSVFTVGVSCWLVYGLLLGAWPIILANAITLTLAISILVMKLRFR